MELIVTDRRAAAQVDPPMLSAAPVTVTPMRLLEIATAQGADLAKLEQLMALHERWEKNEARKAFVAAMAAFKANPPHITKNKLVDFTSQKGRTTYRHATLDEVSEKIAAAMAPHGLSHRWNVDQVEGGQIRVTCVLTHALGHSESVSMSASRDDTGNKNNIQQMGSAVTYLSRYTLLAITGLSTSEQGEADDDGRAAGLQQQAQERPEIPTDVRLALADAAKEGTEALKTEWNRLTPATKDIVTRHHTAWWNERKAQAQAVQS